MMVLILHSSLELHFHTLSWKKYWARASSSSYRVAPRRVLIWSGHTQVFKQRQRKKYKKTAGWSCCYNICVLPDNQQIRFLQSLMTWCSSGGSLDLPVRRSSVCQQTTPDLCEEPHLWLIGTPILSLSRADESLHKMCDTGRALKSAAQIILKFLFRKLLYNATAQSELPWPAGVHEVFVGHFLMWSSCTVLWVNFVVWPFPLLRSHFMNEFIESLL